jgi:hypothetical protein
MDRLIASLVILLALLYIVAIVARAKLTSSKIVLHHTSIHSVPSESLILPQCWLGLYYVSIKWLGSTV